MAADQDGHIRAPTHLQLVHDVADVPGGRAGADDELMGDLAVGQTLGNEQGDLALARTQTVERPIARNGRLVALPNCHACLVRTTIADVRFHGPIGGEILHLEDGALVP